MKTRVSALAAIVPFAAALALFAQPGLASHGSGSDGTPDDDIEDEIQDDIEKEIEKRLEDKIDDKIEDRAEEKAREKANDKAKDRAETRVREKSEEKTREDDKRLRTEKRFEKEIEHKTRSQDGDDSRSRNRVKEREKSEIRVDDGKRSGSVSKAGAITGVVAGTADKATIDAAEGAAKITFDLAKAAADAGRDIARADARAAMEAALAEPGADKEAIKTAYDAAVKAADLQRDVATEEAKAVYEATRDELDALEDGYSDDSGDVIAGAERLFAAATDRNGDEIARGEWLLLTTREDVAAIVKRGFAVKSIEVMDGLGVVLARLEAPESFSLPETSRAVRAQTPSARVDYNHLYFPQADPAIADSGEAPSQLLPLGDAAMGAGERIGVIDTEIDAGHRAFHGAQMIARSFVPYGNARPSDHGTAVASILAGDDDGYSGLAPRAEIVAASVFFENATGKASATTESLVRALDWMSEMHVPIVSMSLAGPPNAILEEAIKRAAARGVMVVAAAGNEGPMARPMYPAAYESAVAVTAVSRDKQVYRLANRGDYVDFAAPGVAVLHAKSGGGYASSSGTSMAAPFVAAALGEMRRGDALTADQAFRLLSDNAEDLGEPGRDPVFGAGLVRPAAPRK
ncbi:MAG: S8 family serine peptidase [Pseudomonadota bacterium]